ncbi:MAG: hypothetical protein WD991_01005 [Candidatus Paceibacterota bacterium]
MKIVTVIPLQKGPIGGDLTYFTSKEIDIGSIVTIPIRSKQALGFVISVEEATQAKSGVKEMNFNLKKIIDIKKNSFFIPTFFSSAIETGKYFASSSNYALGTLIPTILRNEYDQISKWKAIEKNKNIKENDRLRPEKLLLQMPPEERMGIYKTLIRENFALKKSIFIVLPTEHDIKILKKALSKGVEQFIFDIHGGLNAKKTLETLEKIITTGHPILILGTAPFLSVPRRDLGVIILERENSNSYKMISKPYIDLRVFVELFASKSGIKFILSDTLLRFETIARTDLDHFVPMHTLNFRLDFEDKMKIVSSSKKANDRTGGKFQVLQEESADEIKNAIKHDKNVFVFALRKGLATQTICKDCSHVVACPKCSAPVVLYLSESGKKRMLVCNKCRTEMKEDTLCQSCGSWNLLPLGIGTETVFEYLKQMFSAKDKVKIFRMDKESIKTAKQAKKLLEEFEESKGVILVGTEMAVYYLENPVDLSVVAAFDSFWSIPNYKMSEKVVQLLIAIAGKTKEELIIQTKNEKDPALLALTRGNLLNFIREELVDRKNLSYPPYKRFIKITFHGDKTETLRAKDFLMNHFGGYNPEIFSGFISKQKGRYVTNALIKVDPKNWSYPELSAHSSLDQGLLAKLLALPPLFEIFVDPEDLL